MAGIVVGVGDAYHRRAYQRARRVVLEAAGWRCQWPGCSNRATTVDHVTPLAYGGSNDPANLRASCQACNSRGGAAISTENRRRRIIGRRSRPW
jgi:5-methylcytosine-specific restriction endonuclease McrA